MEIKTIPIHERIKELRKKNGWTQSDLAEKLDVELKMVSNYETQKANPSVETLLKIAEIFDVSVDYLLINDAPKQHFHFKSGGKFLEKLSEIENLPDKDKEVIEHMINALIAKNKVKDIIVAAS